MPIKIPKSQAERTKECVVILHKLVTEVGVVATHPSVQLLAKRMVDYARAPEARCMEDRIPLVGSDRYILYRFPRWAHQIVEVVLRKGVILHNGLPDSMIDEVAAGEKAMAELEAMEKMKLDIVAAKIQESVDVSSAASGV
jgi:hypothetical protein